MQKILLFVGFIAMVVTLSTACKKKQTSIYAVFEPQKAAKFHIGVMTGTVTVCFFVQTFLKRSRSSSKFWNMAAFLSMRVYHRRWSVIREP